MSGVARDITKLEAANIGQEIDDLLPGRIGILHRHKVITHSSDGPWKNNPGKRLYKFTTSDGNVYTCDVRQSYALLEGLIHGWEIGVGMTQNGFHIQMRKLFEKILKKVGGDLDKIKDENLRTIMYALDMFLGATEWPPRVFGIPYTKKNRKRQEIPSWKTTKEKRLITDDLLKDVFSL